MKKIFIIILGIAISIYSCKKKNIQPNNNNTNVPAPNEIINNNVISKIDLINSNVLFIKKESVTNSKKFLYSISNDNKIDSIKYYNSAGKLLTYKPEITNMYDINEKWLYISFANYYYIDSIIGSDGLLYPKYKTLDNQQYLLDKTTGNTYDFSSLGTPSRETGYTYAFGKTNVFKLDLAGNIYFRKNENKCIYKLDISNPQNLTASQIFNEQVSDFIVNKDGDIIYDALGNGIRLKSYNSSGLKQLDDRFYWSSYDGYFYTDIYWSSNSKSGIGKINSTGITDTNEFINNTYMRGHSNAIDYVFNLNDKTYLTQDKIIYEVNNKSSKPNGNVNYLLSDPNHMIATKNYMFISNQNNEIQFFNPVTNQPTLIFSGISVYSIIGLNTKNNDNVIVNGLRMSDAKKIIFTMSNNGNMNIIDEKLDIEMTNMISLN